MNKKGDRSHKVLCGVRATSLPSFDSVSSPSFSCCPAVLYPLSFPPLLFSSFSAFTFSPLSFFPCRPCPVFSLSCNRPSLVPFPSLASLSPFPPPFPNISLLTNSLNYTSSTCLPCLSFSLPPPEVLNSPAGWHYNLLAVRHILVLAVELVQRALRQ